jgi:hypothetical protein
MHPNQIHLNPVPCRDGSGHSKDIRLHHQTARDGIPRFRFLPAEIRSSIWTEAMPGNGVYTVQLYGQTDSISQPQGTSLSVTIRVIYRDAHLYEYMYDFLGLPFWDIL